MCKPDLVLNNLLWLIYHKPNQTEYASYGEPLVLELCRV